MEYISENHPEELDWHYNVNTMILDGLERMLPSFGIVFAK
jgi:hypothetical protein